MKNESSFWKKIAKLARKMGEQVVEHALCLYYVVQDPATPTKAKALGYGALAYLISPFDAVPDFIPGTGLADDATILAGAVLTLTPYITEAIRKKAKGTLGSFGF